jgi:hypothetical protein
MVGGVGWLEAGLKDSQIPWHHFSQQVLSPKKMLGNEMH